MAGMTEVPSYEPVECRRIWVVTNPAAGRDEPFLQLMNTTFREAGIDWELRITKERGDAVRLTKEALDNGADVVAAYGGDGTAREVATGLYGTKVPLAIFPGGTANNMCVELGIPQDLAGAVSLVRNGVLRPVDMGKVGNDFFLLRATIGLSAKMIESTPREEKNRLGTLAYILSILKILPDTKSIPYKLILDGQTVEASGTWCLIANSVNVGVQGLTLSKNTSVSDGLLDVILIEAEKLGMLLSVAANVTGVTEPPQHWQVREVTVMTDPVEEAEMDGDMIGSTPIHASIVPGAVRVIVPPPPQPASQPIIEVEQPFAGSPAPALAT
jgi:diacylglycerol kinase (ATP)